MPNFKKNLEQSKKDRFIEITQKAIKKFRENLLDISNRNNLINLNFGKGKINEPPFFNHCFSLLINSLIVVQPNENKIPNQDHHLRALHFSISCK